VCSIVLFRVRVYCVLPVCSACGDWLNRYNLKKKAETDFYASKYADKETPN